MTKIEKKIESVKKDKRTNRVFKSERKDIEFPLWRKKVDKSLFQEKGFTIPKFAEKWWDIPLHFKGISNFRKNPGNKISIFFEAKEYNGYMTLQNSAKRKGTYRLFYDQELADILKEKFLMSFMRDLEHQLGPYDDDSKNRVSIEDVIPFQEFLDIEFSDKDKSFIFSAYYTQQPTFPYLFRKILGTTILKSIALELEGKSEFSIVKSNWKKKEELTSLPDIANVIYMLYDENNNEIYVGEAQKLKSRLSSVRPEIPNWTHFRYDVLPPVLEPLRLEIERMFIRCFASVLPDSKKRITAFEISDCVLKNLKIDI